MSADPDDMVALLRACRPEYGAVGSRDVDVTAQRERIDRAIQLLTEQRALVADVQALLGLLEEREYAEHWATSQLGKRLESAVTDLHNEIHAAQDAALVLPEGWAAVPVTPTTEMVQTGQCYVGLLNVWPAMVARAPAPPDGVESAQALRDMLDDARTEYDQVREALGVPVEPHQVRHERVLAAALAAAYAQADADDEVRHRMGVALSQYLGELHEDGAVILDPFNSHDIDALLDVVEAARIGRQAAA